MISNVERTSDAFIDQARIEELLAAGKKAARDTAQVRAIITKAAKHQGLTAAEVAVLLQVEDSNLQEELFQTAEQIKKDIYGQRIVIFDKPT